MPLNCLAVLVSYWFKAQPVMQHQRGELCFLKPLPAWHNMTHCRHLREGITFRVWFPSSVQHFHVCFVLSALSSSGRRLTKTIGRSEAAHLSVKLGTPGGQRRSLPSGRSRCLNVLSEKAEDLQTWFCLGNNRHVLSGVNAASGKRKNTVCVAFICLQRGENSPTV